jgi:DsbC/DsbD-like thiol-disulfide interchange protein
MAIVLRLMPRLLIFSLAAFLTQLVDARPTIAQDASPWTNGLHSAVRLLSGGRENGHWLAGIEIRLDSDFKTYWRNPGESGLPPRFDWSASENLSEAALQWPAPTRMEDAGGVAYIYSHEVVLPLIVKARDPSRPVTLGLSLDFGVCKDICIPAHADLELTLSPDGAGHRASIMQALAAVPLRQPLGAVNPLTNPLSILSIARQPGDKPTYKVKADIPAGANPALFAEGPDDWYLSISPVDGQGQFTVTVEEKPENAADVPVLLTLTAGGKAIETEVRLDGDAQSR